MTANFIQSEKNLKEQNELSLENLLSEFQLISSAQKRIALIGTQNISITHQQVVEIISGKLVENRNTLITSGGLGGVNLAAIRGAVQANPKYLEIVLPTTLEQQPKEFRELLKKSAEIELVEYPERKKLDYTKACETCYKDIVESAHQLICFLYKDSKTLKKAIEHAKLKRKIITDFYLD